MNSLTDGIMEPIKEFKEHLYSDFKKNSQQYINELVEKSGIDEKQNEKIVEAYNKKQTEIGKFEKQAAKVTALRRLAIAAGVLVIIVGAFFGYSFFSQIGGSGSSGGVLAWTAVFAVVGIVTGILLIVLTVRETKAKLEGINAELSELRAQAEKIKAEAENCLAPLYNLYDWDMFNNLIRKTVPGINLDVELAPADVRYMRSECGYPELTDRNSATVGLCSGRLWGNPFVCSKQINMEMVDAVYTGSLTITWTTVEHDADGNAYTETHLDTLYAEYTSPKPCYTYDTHVAYASPVAGNLSFSRCSSGVKAGTSEKAIARKIKRGERENERRAKRALKEGGSGFTAMANSEFEVLFGANDRNDEVQFRQLFTPLAQRNIVELIKSGDNFDFRKLGKMNYVSSKNTGLYESVPSVNALRIIDVAQIKKTFVDTSCRFFDRLYKELLPILSIPVYSQSRDTIDEVGEYSESGNIPPEEVELLANLARQYVKHSDTASEVIVKCESKEKYGSVDHVCITGNSYGMEQRIAYVSKYGGDGQFHEVPVHYDYYYPLRQTVDAIVCDTGFSYPEFTESFNGGELGSVNSTFGSFYARKNATVLIGLKPGTVISAAAQKLNSAVGSAQEADEQNK